MKLSAIIDERNTKIEASIEKIKRVYLADNRPWIIGYSGGKDSTATVHIIFKALLQLDPSQLKKQIYVISSDTLVETPAIINEIDINLYKIEIEAKKVGLPITSHKVRPQYDNSFWANIIGRGYPVPNQSFRWCTDRMKIEPANRFIKEVVSKHGEAIMVLGIRKGESNSRDRVIENHEVKNRDVMKHSTLSNAYVFAPIVDFSIDDVWNLLLNDQSPWGADNYNLYKLYTDSSSASECPLVVDQDIKESAGSCGNSRFGCWVCTVVNEDKALNGFIGSGINWLIPLLEYRNWLASIRDDRTMRMKKRANGQIYFSPIEEKDGNLIIPKKGKREKVVINQDGIDNFNEQWNVFNTKQTAINFIKKNKIDLSGSDDPKIIIKTKEGYAQLGLGPYTYEVRIEMLRRLLLTEKKLNDKYNAVHKLIKREELLEISRLWLEQGFWDNEVSKIYEEVYGEDLELVSDDIKMLSEKDLDILKEICERNKVDFDLVKKILFLEKNSVGLTRRDLTQKDITRLLNQDYIHL